MKFQVKYAINEIVLSGAYHRWRPPLKYTLVVLVTYQRRLEVLQALRKYIADNCVLLLGISRDSQC